KNAEALETLAKADVLVVDKTGTLTLGKPIVLRTSTLEGAPISKDRMLSLAASVEQASEHPLARAIVTAAQQAGVALSAVEGFRSIAGGGTEGKVNGERVLVGNVQFLGERGVLVPAEASPLGPGIRMEGPYSATLVFVALKDQLVGTIAVGDSIKESTPKALEELRKENVELVMLTGDQSETARFVAGQLGIKHVEAGVRPQRKAEVVGNLRREKKIVVMA